MINYNKIKELMESGELQGIAIQDGNCATKNIYGIDEIVKGKIDMKDILSGLEKEHNVTIVNTKLNPIIFEQGTNRFMVIKTGNKLMSHSIFIRLFN